MKIAIAFLISAIAIFFQDKLLQVSNAGQIKYKTSLCLKAALCSKFPEGMGMEFASYI